MSSPSNKPVTDKEMAAPSEYGGTPKEPARPKAGHEILGEIYRSDPTDPSSGPAV